MDSTYFSVLQFLRLGDVLHQVLFGSKRGILPIVFVLMGITTGCTGSREVDGDDANRRNRTLPAPRYVEMDLATPSGDVKTIQLYRTGHEVNLPIVSLNSVQTLSLEFDLMSERGRPLSVYFYHADRVWQRKLTPSEFLSSFHRDDILDYTPSIASEIPYYHYNYVFPNESISFRMSGNFIVRVTEQGNEDDVLFERAFFLTEQAAGTGFFIDQVIVGGLGYPSSQPIVQFRLPSGNPGSVYDYNVCFIKNGRFDLARCSKRPSLANQPLMEFFLEPELSFEPEEANYFLDLGRLDVGGRIIQTNLTSRPYRIFLEPDYARFAGDALAPLLNGQTVVTAVETHVADADNGAEYVLTHFSYVPPDEQPLAGDVILTGSFNNWQLDPTNRLSWIPDEGRYEGDILLKQGQYEYRYFTEDRRITNALRGAMPRTENAYAALIYYSDFSLSTDRLIAVQETVGP